MFWKGKKFNSGVSALQTSRKVGFSNILFNELVAILKFNIPKICLVPVAKSGGKSGIGHIQPIPAAKILGKTQIAPTPSWNRRQGTGNSKPSGSWIFPEPPFQGHRSYGTFQRMLRGHQEKENPGTGMEQPRLSRAVLGIFSRGIFEVQSPRISGSWNSSRCRGNARRSFSDEFQPRVWEFLPAPAFPGSCRHPLPSAPTSGHSQGENWAKLWNFGAIGVGKALPGNEIQPTQKPPLIRVPRCHQQG